VPFIEIGGVLIGFLKEADEHLPSGQQAKVEKEEEKKGRRKKRNAEMFIDPRPWVVAGDLVGRRALEGWCLRVEQQIKSGETEIVVNTGKGRQKFTIAEIKDIVQKCRSQVGLPSGIVEVKCDWCDGKGYVLDDPRRKCSKCNGVGTILFTECEECDGTGYLEPEGTVCSDCYGAGIV
jgi:hypothetical protein